MTPRIEKMVYAAIFIGIAIFAASVIGDFWVSENRAMVAEEFDAAQERLKAVYDWFWFLDP